MASYILQFLNTPTHLLRQLQYHRNQLSPTASVSHIHHFQSSNIRRSKCTNSKNSTPDDDFPTPPLYSEDPESFPIEKRRKSEILRDRKSSSGLVKPEPPNFEIGWKRTKPIPLEKPTGYMIMDFLEKLEELMGKEYGSTELLEKVGEIVTERVVEEAQVLRDEGKVEDRMVTELLRVLKLMKMDLAMVKAAVKDDTLLERLEQAKARCRQAILVATSF